MYAAILGLALMEKRLEDDCQCEATHNHSEECTYEVVARKLVPCKGLDFLICQASYDYNMKALGVSFIHSCGKPISECWKVIPV